MKTAEKIKAIAAKSGKTQVVVKEVLEALQEVAYEAVKAGDEIKVIDGLTLKGVDVPEKTYRNPSNGATVVKPAHRAPKAKVGKALKDATL